MLRILGVVSLIIATSCYIFPFEFKALPGVNTKMAMAGVGLIVLFFQLAQNKDALLNRYIFNLSLSAVLVSLIGLASITYNATSDTSYMTYVVSVWVWLGGAYFTVKLMKVFHGYISVSLIGNYLIAACVMQCVLAIMIDRIPAIFNVVNTYIGNFGVGGSAEGFAEMGRLYGIGAAVDFAGARFAPVLLIISFLCVYLHTTILKKYLLLYIFAFLVITFIGNMMSRTTVLGTLMSLCYWGYMSRLVNNQIAGGMVKILAILFVSIPLIIYWYQTNLSFQGNFRFGFEGFFSLAEKGYWETHSNNVLEGMYRLPESVKTWLIGDGYFDNPTSDPTYTGYMWKGFYMGTDVGYLRFIYYFGVLGLLAMISFIIYAGVISMKRIPSCRMLFFMLILVNFVIWFKVSTDMFPILALFLMISKEDNDAYMEHIALKS